MSEVADDIQSDGLLQEQTGNAPVEKAPVTDKPVDTTDKTGLRDAIRAATAKVNDDLAAKGKPVSDSLKNVKAPEGRGPDGKFLPKDKIAAPDKVEPVKDVKAPEGAQTGAEQKPLAAPGTWKAEAKAEWEKLSPSVKAEIHRRESDFSRDNAKFQQQIQQINQAYTPIEQVIGPKRALWRAQFGSEADALKQLVNLSDLASQSPNDFLAYYLSQPNVASQVDTQKIFGQQAPGDDISRHPALQAALQKINGLEKQVTGFFSQAQTQQTQNVEQQIQQFAQEAGHDGQPMRPHFEAVREDVFNMIPALKAQFPQASVTQIMDKAYNIAIRTNDGVSGEVKRQDEERIRSELEKKERAAKAALANKSIPPGGPAPNAGAGSPDGTDLRAMIKRNAAKVWGNETARI